MKLPFLNRHHEEARRAALVEILADQIGPSVRRRRDGTTDVRSLMDQLQAGDQGDSRLESLRGAWAAQTRMADSALTHWGSMTPEAWSEAYPWAPQGPQS